MMSIGGLLSPSVKGITVSQRFNKLLENLQLTESQLDDGKTKHSGVRKCLNNHYYNSDSDSNNSLLVGSWGKFTRVRPPRDIDILFELPYSVYLRFSNRMGNVQSQILQEVKGVLNKTYTTTEKMRGDGQVVLVPFQSYAVEVLPAIKISDDKYWICDTNNGGKFKVINPQAEIDALRVSDKATNGNTRALIRMLKCWQQECNVPIKSFWLELLVAAFLSQWQYSDKSSVYYDWMIRDFFQYLKSRENGILILPGTGELIAIGNAWKTRVDSAHASAITACKDGSDYPNLAGLEWQKIFGTYIPIS